MMYKTIIVLIYGFNLIVSTCQLKDFVPDYGEVIKLSLLFYESQRSGHLPSSTTDKIYWRGDSALNDKGDNGEDLTGGYYDGK